MDSPSSDTPRQSLLGSINFLARSNRPRAATTSNNPNDTAPTSPSLQLPTSISSPGHRRRPAAAAAAVVPPPIQTSNTANSGLGYMLRRRRSATALVDGQPQRTHASDVAAAPSSGPTHRIRLVPHLESHRSLHFDAITRDVRQGDAPLRIGRFTDRSAHSGGNGNKLAFKSKVVSRGHAEVWFDTGSFYIKDTKSSSGTFLNHIRLSSPNTESRPHAIKDGDVLQLGVDYQGGTEEIYRCVKMRVELGREWQSGVNAFNSSALQQLKTLSGGPPKKDAAGGPAEKRAKSNITDCCICLFQVTVCQSLFIAPCSHVYHYKCIRPLLEMHHPGFSCPLCRTFADLEADVEIEAAVDSTAGKDMDLSALDMTPDAHPQEDVEMGLEDVEEVQPEEEAEGDADADRTSSSSVGSTGNVDAAAADTHSPPVAIPLSRRRSAEAGFPGAEATPLNSTFLATLARAAGGGSSSGEGSGGLGVIAMSDDEEVEAEGEGEDEGAASDDAGGESGVGGKRKR